MTTYYILSFGTNCACQLFWNIMALINNDDGEQLQSYIDKLYDWTIYSCDAKIDVRYGPYVYHISLFGHILKS